MVKTNLLLASMFIGSTVFAQAPAPSSPSTPPPENAINGTVDLSVKQRPTLTPAEMVNQSKEYLQGMAQVVKRIQSLQEEAKRQKDIIRLNCVTDKLVQARVNENIAEQSMAALQENVAKNDLGGETHEFTRLTIVNQKVTVVGAEAENCIGEDLSFVGATRVDVEVDQNIPQYDPTQPGSPFIDITRPPEASPVQ